VAAQVAIELHSVEQVVVLAAAAVLGITGLVPLARAHLAKVQLVVLV
jgi:hypothetical protein